MKYIQVYQGRGYDWIRDVPLEEDSGHRFAMKPDAEGRMFCDKGCGAYIRPQSVAAIEIGSEGRGRANLWCPNDERAGENQMAKSRGPGQYIRKSQPSLA